jgi:hypothetical protein
MKCPEPHQLVERRSRRRDIPGLAQLLVHRRRCSTSRWRPAADDGTARPGPDVRCPTARRQRRRGRGIRGCRKDGSPPTLSATGADLDCVCSVFSPYPQPIRFSRPAEGRPPAPPVIKSTSQLGGAPASLSPPSAVPAAASWDLAPSASRSGSGGDPPLMAGASRAAGPVAMAPPTSWLIMVDRLSASVISIVIRTTVSSAHQPSTA